MHELILIEILAVPAERSRGRHNPRAVKRKMSRFPTKARAAPPSPDRVFRYEEHIRVVAPVGSPADRAPSPAAAPKKKGPKRDRSREAAAPTGHGPSWSTQVRSWQASGLSRAAFCEHQRLDARAFNRWVARSRQTRRTGGS